DRFQSMAEFGRAIQAMSDPDAASVINALMAQITHRSTSDSTEDTAIGPRREPSAAELEHKASASIDSSESYENAVRLLYSRNVSDQDHAFSQLTKLEGDSQKHLLFDLARKLCMWSNSSLTGSPTKFALVPGSPITMGRGASAVELPLDDLGVSRQHLAFFLVGDKVEVEDLSTANGTLLNGMQISRTSRALLSDNDRLQVGDCDIHVHITYAAQ
ncbi:MAG: FHA domain-containing protein, partial [Kiritimatiellae bacterium]|nr:FHA domain-containing protein [Kiritimatiellia bacterium]